MQNYAISAPMPQFHKAFTEPRRVSTKSDVRSPSGAQNDRKIPAINGAGRTGRRLFEMTTRDIDIDDVIHRKIVKPRKHNEPIVLESNSYQQLGSLNRLAVSDSSLKSSDTHQCGRVCRVDNRYAEKSMKRTKKRPSSELIK